jgi:multicomponent Na+:H+ antiporter subunit D
VSVLVPLPVVLSLLGAAVSLALHGRVRLQRAVGLAVCAVATATAIAVLAIVQREGVVAVQAGGWPAPFGITLVVDGFAAIMVTISTLMQLGCLVYAFGQLDAERERLYFHPVYLVLQAGVCLSFLTGDLFNLFVAFEVMLIASYVLLVLGGSQEQVGSGMTYVVINLLASTLFVSGVGLVYAATGTVNMADLAGRLAELPPNLRDGLGLLFLVVFGVKAALFPLFFWLPDSYPAAPTAIAAVFAGLLTKVGVYAVMRTQTLLFPGDGGPSTLILGVAGATMLVGVLGAIAQNDIKRILSFHIISQIGYMIMGLGLYTLAGLAAGIYYIVHHIVVKTALFLVAGLVERAEGTDALARLGGFARKAPLVGALFMLPALSLAGLPPSSGFVAKLALVREGLALDRVVIVGVGLLVSLFTLFSMTKVWQRVFWGMGPPPEAARGQAPDERTTAPIAGGAQVRLPATMVGATAALVALSLVIAATAGPLYTITERAAADMLDSTDYLRAVLGG